MESWNKIDRCYSLRKSPNLCFVKSQHFDFMLVFSPHINRKTICKQIKTLFFLEMLFGQMPVLEVDGEQIAHSRAAFRYLAREFNLMGADSMTSAQIDMWIEVVIEGVMKLPFGEKDEEVKV